jgi:hypothetical protein
VKGPSPVLKSLSTLLILRGNVIEALAGSGYRVVVPDQPQGSHRR